MGGGEAMGTVAKVAGIGGVVVQSGTHCSQSLTPVDQALWKASFPASEPIALSASVDATVSTVAPMEKSTTWELDDWEFAGEEEELVMSAGEPMPRVVFTDVPTLQEAKEANSDLKDALDKVYLFKTESSEIEQPSAADDKVCGTSVSSDSDSNLETKSCLISETAVTPSAPNHALHAFRVISQSTEAQNVVASIACDPNVWTAVLQNSAVIEFFESQQKAISNVHLIEYRGPESSENLEDSSGSKQHVDFIDSLKDLLRNIKLTMDEMILVSSQSISTKLNDLKKLNLLIIDSKGRELFAGPFNNVSSWCLSRMNWESLDLSSASTKLWSTVDLGSSKLRSTVDLGATMSALRPTVYLGSSKLRSTVDLGSAISTLRSTVDTGSSKVHSTVELGSSKLLSTVNSIMGNLYRNKLK